MSKKIITVLLVMFICGITLAQRNQHQERIQTETQNTEKIVQTQTRTKERVQEKVKIGTTEVVTNMEITKKQVNNQERIQAQLSNGTNAEIKIMPEVASLKARERLQSRNCTEEEGCQIQLKEVGQKQEIQAAYEIQTMKEVKVFRLFKAQMKIISQINAENGEVIKEKKPRRSFLATEKETKK